MGKQRRKSRKKTNWTSIIGFITFAGVIIALLNDSSSLIDRFSNTLGRHTATVEPSNSLVPEYFPLFANSTRTYNVAGSSPSVGGGPTILTSSIFTEKVIMVTSGTEEDIHVYQIEQTGGEIYDMDCTGFETNAAPNQKWYIEYRLSFFVACTDEAKNKVISELMSQKYSRTPTPNYSEIFPILIFPLTVDASWPAFPGIPDDEPSYHWYVEEKFDYTVPAGKFSNCYRVVLYTASGTNIRYFCDGIGNVAMEYHHNGMPVDFRVELVSYSIP